MRALCHAILISATLLGSACSDSDSEEKTIDTPEGPITVTTTSAEPTPQEIVAVEADKVRAFEARSIDADRFVAAYLPRVKSATLAHCDEAFRLWQLDKNSRFTKDEVVEILGSYLGNKLSTELGMEWVRVTDEYGTDYAVRAKKIEVMAYPFSSVLKRVENDEYDFMSGIYYTVREHMSSGEYKPR